MKTRYILLFSISLIVFGCGDFLEPKSKSEFVPKDANSLNEILLGTAYPRYDVGKLNLFLYLLDDDVDGAPWQQPAVGQDPNRWVAAFSWQPRMYEKMEEAGQTNPDIYKTCYSLILGANAVLDYCKDIPNTDHDLDAVKAQAYTLRAFYYFRLVNIFGPPYNSDKKAPGVPLKLNSGIEESVLERRSVEEVYAQILEDLENAEHFYLLLPEEQQWEPDFRTSLPMVHLLFSRVFLYMEEWEKAALYAEKVMKHPSFRLLDLNQIPAEGTQYGMVFPQYINYHAYDRSSEVVWLYGNIKDHTEGVFSNALYPDWTSQHAFFRASKALMDSFEEGDLRKERYIIRSWYSIGDELMPQAFGKINVADGQNYYQPQGGIGIFARSLRLSEAYLNYSEAKAMLYKEGDAAACAEAVNAVDELRRCRFSSEEYKRTEITDPELLIRFIREERRRELCFEDQRWFDLRRWGMPEITHTWFAGEHTKIVYTLEEKDKGYTLPLPPQALEANVRLVQNPLAPARAGKSFDVQEN